MRPILLLLFLLCPFVDAAAAPGVKVPPGTVVMLMGQEFSPAVALKGAATAAPMAYRVGQQFEEGRDSTPEEEKALTEASYQVIVRGGQAKYDEALKSDRAGPAGRRR